MKITKEQLRNFFINYHGFNEFFALDPNDAVSRIFERIRSVQFDPLNVAGRNAELVLFSRNGNITRKTLYDRLYGDRTLVDGWDKMMCIFRSSEFRRFKFVRERMAENYAGTMAWRGQKDCFGCMDEVYSYIDKNGATLVTEIPSRKTSDGGWGPTKAAGVCCEYLFFSGKLVVSDKKGVVKSFDTAERVFGKNADSNEFSSFDEFMLWYVKRRIAACGAVWNKNGGAWLGVFTEKADERTPVINELSERGEIMPIEVEGEAFALYAERGAERFLEMPTDDRAILVAPLDNMMWDRKLVKKIFDFDYSLEVYIPAQKRKYGYYVLPIIIGNRFVGRLEPLQYKAGEPLTVKNVWYERGDVLRADDIEKIYAEISRLAKFLGVEPAADTMRKLTEARGRAAE